MKINHAIILAAGRGTRMLPLSKKTPKAMIKIDGKSLIERGIKEIKKKIENIYITVGHHSSLLSAHVISKGVNLIINTEGRGNSWWLYNSLVSKINQPVLVLTCDNLIKLNYDFILKQYKKNKKPDCLMFPVNPVKGCEGDYIFTKKNKVLKLSRNKKSSFYASGMQIVNPKKINDKTKPVENFSKVWKQLIDKNRLYVSDIYPGKWFAIDNPRNLNFFKKDKILKKYFFK